ncbi:unnamed protein product [Alternaria alternata]
MSDTENGPYNVPRSHARRQLTPLSTSGFLGPRFDKPPIVVNNVEGQSRPADEGDYGNHPITYSESRGSEGASSIHKVDDLGFDAAATKFPAWNDKYSDCSSIVADALEAVFAERKVRHSSRRQLPLESGCVQSSLLEKVGKALDWSQLDAKEYLPLDSFESIFDPKTIALLLDELYNFGTDEELEDKFASIMDRRSGRDRRRILGVLVFMEKVEYIEDFIQEDIWDDQLPLERSAGDSMGYVVTRNSGKYNLMERWGRSDIELFCSYQKMFFVPFFDIHENRLCFYELESNIRLPWKTFEYKTNGGSGIIHKVEIHPSHHNFPVSNSTNQPMFALKTVETGDHRAYREELSALEKACAQVQREKHLIKLLLTFRHGEKFFLLFEWADGNLGEFWRLHPFRSMSLDDRWAAEQCRGLARAVSRIHGLTTWQKKHRSSSVGLLDEAERDWGRHGDIKPENILWFEEYGTDRNLLVISDLGLTRYHSQFSKSFVPRSNIDGCSWAYRPPELDIDESISQKYDIWSLGCVFLEFCVWYLQGHDEVDIFWDERESEDLPTFEGVKNDKFFNIEKSEDGETKQPRVKKAVQRRLNLLKDIGGQTTFASKLLYVIEHKMLRCAPDDRETIDVIRTDLSEIVVSITRETNALERSRDLAHIRRDDSAPSLQAPSNISFDEEPRYLTIESPSTFTGDGGESALMMRTRPRRVGFEAGEPSRGDHNTASTADEQYVSKVPVANSMKTTLRDESKDQSSERVPGQSNLVDD